MLKKHSGVYDFTVILVPEVEKSSISAHTALTPTFGGTVNLTVHGR